MNHQHTPHQTRTKLWQWFQHQHFDAVHLGKSFDFFEREGLFFIIDHELMEFVIFTLRDNKLVKIYNRGTFSCFCSFVRKTIEYMKY